MARFAKTINKLKGSTLLDTQLYNPHCNHTRLTNHDYWPKSFDTSMLFSDKKYLSDTLSKIITINNIANTTAYIVPGFYCDKVERNWEAIQNLILETAATVMVDKPRLATICISAEVLRDEEALEKIIGHAEKWNVNGYYIIAENPRGQYLVGDPLWLGNLMSFCAGLKLQKRQVIVGYCSHQMLGLASSNVDAIASGSFLNVRSFPMGKFNIPEEESKSRRAVWYYCPHSLSEYKLTFLDAAQKRGVLPQLAPDRGLESNYANVLFTGAQPSTTNFKDRLSFLHYLQCLYSQCKAARRSTFKETVHAHELQLQTANNHIEVFHKYGVRGQNRDFKESIDVNFAALGILEDSRGFVLSRQW